LAIAQGIVADHGGRIEVTSRLGKGTIFRVVLAA
jgi:signal transduction histidine kinase